MDFPKWQLHRGYWKEGIRENTMAAFEEAKNMNCQMIELDTQLSRDGHFHVFHDFSLKRFFHVDQKIARTSSEDLSGLGIPRLEEVLKNENVPEFINVEVKTKSVFGYVTAAKFKKVISPFMDQKKILVSSFNPVILFWIKRLMPELPRAFIVGDSKVLTSWRFEHYMKLADPNFLNCHYGLIDDDECREHVLFYEKPIMVWTVNEHSKAQFYLTRGAKSIISDLPPRSKI